MRRITEKVYKKLTTGHAVVLATILEKSGSAPREAGAQMLVCKDGSIEGTVGGGILEAKVIERALTVYDTKTDQTDQFSLNNEEAGSLGMVCGGAVKVSLAYLDPENRPVVERYAETLISEQEMMDRVIIIGAGHVAQQVARYTHDLGFFTAVIDDRESFANRDRYPTAEEITVVQSFEGLSDEADLYSYGYIIIVTRGHAHDKDVLAQALKTDADYIGMIGSTKKRDATYALLTEEGFTQADIARVHCPIGLSIGAQTPEEIAVSIAAELIQHRRGIR